MSLISCPECNREVSENCSRFHGGQTVYYNRMQLRLHAVKPCQSLGVKAWFFLPQLSAIIMSDLAFPCFQCGVPWHATLTY